MDHKRLRILLVDDDEATRKLTAAWIRNDGRFEVVGEAANGVDAVDLVAALQPDAVLLDLVLPGMSGLVALPHLLRKVQGLCVVVYAHALTPEMAIAARDAGAAAAFDKSRPFSQVLSALAGRSEEHTSELQSPC